MRPEATAAPVPVADETTRKISLQALVPYLIGLLFFVLALRGVDATDVIDTDAARHAMNGAFFYDLIRTGNWAHPIEYAKQYYAQYPALSMPYHPPLFPAVEALFFAIFGVRLLTARMAVAVSVAISSVLLYRLVRTTFGRDLIAACVTITTLSLWTFQFVARDVMLEFPALALTLAAIYCIRGLEESFPLRYALLFAGLSAAAVWTKQHAVFLGAVPVLYAVLTKRWRRFFEAPFWVGLLLFGGTVFALIRLSRMFHGTGVDQMSTSASDLYWIVTRTLPAYFEWIAEDLKGLPGVFAVCAIGTYLMGLRKRDSNRPKSALYFAWMIAMCALLIDLGPVTPRYFFFLLPPVIAVGYVWLFHGCRWLWGERTAHFALVGFTIAWFVMGLFIPMDFLTGPGTAAAAVVRGVPTRVLYAGAADGNFAFSVRTLDPNLQVTVISAGKVSPRVLDESPLEAFCKKYGIEWVVFENAPGRTFWAKFYSELKTAGVLERSVPLRSTRQRWRSGAIEVYHFSVAQNHPGGVLQLPVPNIGTSIPLKL